MTFREVMQKLGLWNSAQRDTYKALSHMTDRELQDIGLNRGDIMRLINEVGKKEVNDE